MGNHLTGCWMKRKAIPKNKIDNEQNCKTSAAASSRLIDGITVLSFRTAIDKRAIKVDTRAKAIIKYTTPFFRATATVRVAALDERRSLQVGWIQVCTGMHFRNYYGRLGYSSWELPELNSGCQTMVSDSDGKRFPWYGVGDTVVQLSGPTRDVRKVTVKMDDNFYPSVTWHVPANGMDCKSRLTRIRRNQTFLTCLAVRDSAGSIYVLRAVRWSIDVDIALDPTTKACVRKPYPRRQQQPQPVAEDIVFPEAALTSPTANTCQTLVWRPYHGKKYVSVPPLYTTVDVEQYVAASNDQGTTDDEQGVHSDCGSEA